MNRRKNHRLRFVAQTISTLPFRRDVLTAAYRHFCESGELPESQGLADAVTRWVLAGPNEPPRELCGDRPPAHRRPLPTIREALLYEAVWGTGMCRKAAHTVLEWEVGKGGDVTSPLFLADRSLPEHGSVAMHLLGIPERLAKPPYVAQANRLFVRYRVLRAILPQGEPGWEQPFANAILRFERTGELPEDGLIRDVVLADAELVALVRHRRGQDVRELMAAFDEAASTKGEEREAAIAAVQGLLRPSRGPAARPDHT